MDGEGVQFLGMAGITPWIFAGLSAAALVTAFISSVTGAAGGLILLMTMALVFPPALLIPLHTVVQLGAAGSMAIAYWRYVLQQTLLPFTVGAAIGAMLGGRVFISLSEGVLQLILGVSVLVLAWIPRIARFGPEHGRFVFVGFLTTFLGVFISATGTLLATFTAAAAPDRRNHMGTLGGLMCIVHISKLIAFGFIGVGFGSFAPLLALMIALSFVGTWLARFVLDQIPERLFRIAFQILLTLLSVRLIWIAVGSTF